MTGWKWRHSKYGEFVFMQPSPTPRTTLQHFIPSSTQGQIVVFCCFFSRQKTNHFMLVGFFFKSLRLQRFIAKIHPRFWMRLIANLFHHLHFHLSFTLPPLLTPSRLSWLVPSPRQINLPAFPLFSSPCRHPPSLLSCIAIFNFSDLASI